MKKLLDLLSKTNIAMICLIAITVRIVLIGASIGDSIAYLGLCGLFGFVYYTNSLNATWMKTMTENLKVLRDEVSGMKVSQNMRKMNDTAQKKPQAKEKRFF